MGAPRFINELDLAASLSAGAAIAIVQDGQTLRTTPEAIITQAATYTPSGSGAVARDLQTKVREIEKSRNDYGTFAELMTAVSAGEGKVPAGTYALTSALTPPTGVDLVGAGRINTILDFALSSAGSCVVMEGTNSSAGRVRSTLRRLRVEGTDCADANCIGVSLNWNQSQNPILDEVSIYGGYPSGTTTGLKTGLRFVEDGSNWVVSFNELHIEGCHGDALVIDTATAGASNIINFNGGKIEHNKGRNVVVTGPNDDADSMQINFRAMTIQDASFSSTGVASSVHVEGVKANFSEMWFESGSNPNWADHEVRVESGRASFHNCHWAHARRCVYAGGTVNFTGQNTLRSDSLGIHIAAAGVVNIMGEAVEFLGAGTPFSFDNGATLNWLRSKTVTKTDDYTITRGDYGCTFTNQGAKKNIALTMPLCMNGVTLAFSNGGLSVRTSAYRWVASGSGTNEWYLELAAGGDPGLTEPTKFTNFGASKTKGTVGTLANDTWAWGNNDTLGFNTVYYRTASDPDTQSVDSIIIGYTITITPVSSQRLSLIGTTVTDSIVDDGTPGNYLAFLAQRMTNTGGIHMQTAKTGTWA